MADAQYTIKDAAQRTGLSLHVIRIWEKRYSAVKPERTRTQRRLYSEEQIERLSLLRQLTRSGRSIGSIGGLATEVLRKQANGVSLDSVPLANPIGVTDTASSLMESCLSAVKALDARAFDEALKRAETVLGLQGLLQRVIGPLIQALGDLWREGFITAAHEHFASALLRTYLAQSAQSFAGGSNGPVLVVVTPVGQLHELGALLVSAISANLGWHVIYLGASLPAPEIASAVIQNGARAVALSLVYPEDDQKLPGELRRLRELLPEETFILAGGRSRSAYSDVLGKIGALQIKDLKHLCSILDRLRKPTQKVKHA